MEIKVVCSECGHNFVVNKVNNEYTPKKCPVCGKIIISNSRTATSEIDTAWVK